MLAGLIDITEHLVRGDLWIVWAMAQRMSAQAKIRSSIE
jgi:hypothetical protein